MDDARAMRAFERIRHLDRVGERFVEPERRLPLEPCGQRNALDQLHDEVVEALMMTDVVDSTNVGMIEGRNRAGFALEARSKLRISRTRLRQDLDGHPSAEAR